MAVTGVGGFSLLALYTYKQLNKYDRGEKLLGLPSKSMLDPPTFITQPGVQITANFNSSEFVSPDTGQVQISKSLVERLQAIRNSFGSPVIIHRGGGFRTPTYNAKVTDAKLSQHLYGKAADFHIEGVPIATLHQWAKRNWLDNNIGGVGYYKWGIHLDEGPVRTWGTMRT